MVPKLILRAAEKAATPIEETMIPKVFKKAGLLLTEEKFRKMEWFLNFGPGSWNKPIEKNLGWRDRLQKEVMPLIDFEQGEAAVKKAEALGKGCAAVDRELKGWRLVSRVEQWAGGLIASAAFLTNPLSCARMVFGAGEKSGDTATYFLMVAGTAIFGFAAWARMKISEARKNFNYLSESAAYLAKEVAPADAKAKELASGTGALLERVKKERSENGAMWNLSAAKKISRLGVPALETPFIDRFLEQAADLWVILSKARQELDPLEEKAGQAEGFSRHMSSRGQSDLDSARKNLAEIKAVCADLEKTINLTVEGAEAVGVGNLGKRGSGLSGLSVSVIEGLSMASVLLANNSRLEHMQGSDEKILQKFAIEQSEQDVYALAGMLRRQIELEPRNVPKHSPVVFRIASALSAVSGAYLDAVSSDAARLNGACLSSQILIAQCQMAIEKAAGQN